MIVLASTLAEHGTAIREVVLAGGSWLPLVVGVTAWMLVALLAVLARVDNNLMLREEAARQRPDYDRIRDLERELLEPPGLVRRLYRRPRARWLLQRFGIRP